MTDLIVLALLLEEPRYGYDIKKDAAVVLGHKPLHNNIVYPLLAKFRKRGWVRRRKAPGERGQTRQMYTLTRAGRAETLRRVREFSEEDARNPAAFQARVSLFGMLKVRERGEILAKREQVLLRSRARLKEIEKHFAMGQFARAVIELRRKQTETERAWLRKLWRIRKRVRRGHVGKRG